MVGNCDSWACKLRSNGLSNGYQSAATAKAIAVKRWVTQQFMVKNVSFDRRIGQDSIGSVGGNEN